MFGLILQILVYSLTIKASWSNSISNRPYQCIFCDAILILFQSV